MGSFADDVFRKLVWDAGPSQEGSCAQDARWTAEKPYRGFRSAPGQPEQLEWKERKRTDAALKDSVKGLEPDEEHLDVKEKLPGSGRGCDDVGS